MTIVTLKKAQPRARHAAAGTLVAALAALWWSAAGEARTREGWARGARAAHDAWAHGAWARDAKVRHARARYARTLHATDRATLHYVSSTVNVFYETGRASGTLSGWMRVHMRLGTRFSGSYVILTAGGSIRGHGSATPHGSGTYESFAGTITVTGGTGRFSHAHGHARVYGTFDRMNNELKLHTTGTLYY